MSILSGCVTIWFAAPDAESVARAVKLKIPEEVGVPVIAPVAAFSVRPVGSVPLARDHVIAPCPPVDASVAPVYA
jgi:hypothetical protein